MNRAGVRAPAARKAVPRPAARRPPVRKARARQPARRLALCSTLIVVSFAILAGRVAQLQLLSGDKYKNLATAQALHKVPLSAQRGSVFDRNGRDLAMSIERTTVYADPTLVDDPAVHATKLAPVVGVDQQLLLQRLSDRGTEKEPRRFAYLARTVDDSVAQAVKELNLSGIGFVPESERSYPAGESASVILGRVGTEGTGLDGLEYWYDEQLAGKPGELVVERDPKGHDIPNTERTRVAAERGTYVVLTLDESLQYEVEYSLLDQVRATGSNGGMAAVVDVTNGDVLAMATVNGAKGKEPARVARAGERNAPVMDLFEPGSTNKLITLSWALEHGHVAADTMFEVPDYIQVDPELPAYEDAEPHKLERWTTAEILRHSSNVGTIKIAMKMRNEELAEALRAFGLGARTTIEFPGQEVGLLIPPEEYYATGKYSSAIGYGVSVTGMQMLDTFSTIANGGVTRPPHLLGATIDAEGERHLAQLPAGRRVVSANTAAIMRDLLEGAVTNGTGACAAVPGYHVAGKTGTAKKALPTGGYAKHATMASFIGFAPAYNPRFAALVVLDADNLQYGGAVAAPVFSEIMQFALTQYGVAPTDPVNDQYNESRLTAEQSGHRCIVPHGDDRARALAEQQAARQEVQARARPGDGSTAERETSADSLPNDPSQQN